jgi:hypothetical protein
MIQAAEKPKAKAKRAPKKPRAKTANAKAIKRNPGLPKHEPTPKDRQLVQLFMAQGYTVERAARAMGIGETTLRKYYTEELETGADKAMSAVAGTLFGIAMDRNHPKCVTAAIFLLKTKGGYKESAPAADPENPDERVSFTINIGGSGPPPALPKIIDA